MATKDRHYLSTELDPRDRQVIHIRAGYNWRSYRAPSLIVVRPTKQRRPLRMVELIDSRPTSVEVDGVWYPVTLIE